jgi:hypothetical protein
VKPDAYLLDNYNIRGMHRDARLYKDVDLFTPASLSRLVNAWDPESGLGSRLYPDTAMLYSLYRPSKRGLAAILFELLSFGPSGAIVHPRRCVRSPDSYRCVRL